MIRAHDGKTLSEETWKPGRSGGMGQWRGETERPATPHREMATKVRNNEITVVSCDSYNLCDTNKDEDNAIGCFRDMQWLTVNDNDTAVDVTGNNKDCRGTRLVDESTVMPRSSMSRRPQSCVADLSHAWPTSVVHDWLSFVSSTPSFRESCGEQSASDTSFLDAFTVNDDFIVGGVTCNVIVDDIFAGDGVIADDDRITDVDTDDNSHTFVFEASVMYISLQFRDVSVSVSPSRCSDPPQQLSVISMFSSASQRYRLSGSDSAPPSGDGSRARLQPRGEPTGVVLTETLVAPPDGSGRDGMSCAELAQSQGCARHWTAVIRFLREYTATIMLQSHSFITNCDKQRFTDDRNLQRFTDDRNLQRFTDDRNLQRFTDDRNLERFTERNLQRFTDDRNLQRFTDDRNLQRFTDDGNLERFTERNLQRFTDDKNLQRFTDDRNLQRFTDDRNLQRFTDDRNLQRFTDDRNLQRFTDDRNLQRFTDDRNLQRFTDDRNLQRFTDDRNLQRFTDDKHLQRFTDDKHLQRFTDDQRVMKSQMSSARKKLTKVHRRASLWWSRRLRLRCLRKDRQGSRGSPARCLGTSLASYRQRRANNPSTWRKSAPRHSWYTIRVD